MESFCSETMADEGRDSEGRGDMDPVWLCGFGRSESSEKSADTSQTQAVGKSSMKSGTKGFTGLEGIRITVSEPWWCVCVCACVHARSVCLTELRILY